MDGALENFSKKIMRILVYHSVCRIIKEVARQVALAYPVDEQLAQPVRFWEAIPRLLQSGRKNDIFFTKLSNSRSITASFKPGIPFSSAKMNVSIAACGTSSSFSK
jgi:hypothetical protein